MKTGMQFTTRDAGLERGLGVEAGGLLGSHRQVVDQDLGARLLERVDHLGVRRLPAHPRPGRCVAPGSRACARRRRRARRPCAPARRSSGARGRRPPCSSAARRSPRRGPCRPCGRRCRRPRRPRCPGAGSRRSPSAGGRWHLRAASSRSARGPGRASSRSCRRPTIAILIRPIPPPHATTMRLPRRAGLAAETVVPGSRGSRIQ